MALKALKCPNCEANIQIDDDREYGFCSYCGAQVQLKETIKIELSDDVGVEHLIDGMFEKKIEDGKALLKLADYYRADQLFAQLVKENPGRPKAYEMRIRSFTRDNSVFTSGTKNFVMAQADMMVKVASEEEKAYYEGVRQKLIVSYEEGIRKQQEQKKTDKLAKAARMTKEIYVMIAGALILAVYGASVKSGLLVFFAMAVVIVLIILEVVLHINQKKLTQQDEELSMLEEFIADISEEFLDE